VRIPDSANNINRQKVEEKKENNIIIGNRLRRLRESKNQSQLEVAHAIGLKTQAAYGKLESGDVSLSPKNCVALADFFNVSCDYILRGVEAKNINVCKQTGLHQESIEVLQEKINELNRCANEVKKLDAIAIQKRDSFVDHVLKSAKSDQLPGLDIFDSVQESERQASLAYEQLRGMEAESELLNSLIRDKDIWGELRRACNNIGDSMMDIIYTRTHSQDGSIPLEKEKEDLKGIDAARYVAGQAFGVFFSSLCYDSNFIKCITPLTDNDIQKAVKMGILFEK